jgi:hypothetical protein
VENAKDRASWFIKEHFEILVIAAMMIGAFMVNRSDLQVINSEMATIRKECADEMKDFHGRLCVLEERYLQILQKNTKE